MENPFTKAGSKPEEAFAGAAEHFFELLRTLGFPALGNAPDWASLAAPLASQFEHWLRMSQSVAPWFAAAGTGAAAEAGSGSSGAAAPWPGALPLGPAAAAQGADARRVFELLGHLAQLQGQLAVHWHEIAATASQRFVARLGAGAVPPTTPERALKLYELWVSCAEEAYAATVHKEDFGRLQAELANTSAALMVEQRRHAETLVRAFGLPTRGEVDELYSQLKELRRQLAELAHTPRAADRGGSRRPARPRAAARPRAQAPPRAPRVAGRRAGKRVRSRRSRR